MPKTIYNHKEAPVCMNFQPEKSRTASRSSSGSVWITIAKLRDTLFKISEVACHPDKSDPYFRNREEWASNLNPRCLPN
eukprot:5175172-Pyramimonas_sp.AAC.1